ncbi:glycosyltransferase [Methylobacterium sp. NEAU K]|uniref:glycosyltransferase n=1 Tax=Methylobacterium sp. NEAU K TaxID=3064946 RepID=UPI0027330043|nr:glycosyltransferase [Methylobacterium sp. NEAU K]MDP4006137.1 glycosyltransferase [Methylobacterium sp. NEAU K]
MRVSVVIPTLNRPAALSRALASVRGQRLPAGTRAEILVVDNSPDGNAEALVTRFGAEAGGALPVRYLAVPQPGVASARNAGIAAATGDWIAFIDDDEEAAHGWLAALIAVARQGGADAVFGPVHAQAEGGAEIGAFAAYFSRRVCAADGADVTDRAAYLGTNNSMFSAAACASVAGPFEERLNSIGGEDSLFLRRLVLSGHRFAWAAEARITEWVPPRRLTWTYVRRRRFLSGQIRTFVHEMAAPRRRLAVVRWMVVGAVQVVSSGALALALRPFHEAASRRHLVTAWGGLGKVFWMARFRGSLYGTGLVS